MTDLFDTGAVRDDDRHWETLAARIAAAAARSRTGSVLEWLAGARVTAAIVCLVLAVAVVLLVRQIDASRTAMTREEWTLLLAPRDAVGRMIATGDRPPEIGGLLDQRRGGAR